MSMSKAICQSTKMYSSRKKHPFNFRVNLQDLKCATFRMIFSILLLPSVCQCPRIIPGMLSEHVYIRIWLTSDFSSHPNPTTHPHTTDCRRHMSAPFAVVILKKSTHTYTKLCCQSNLITARCLVVQQVLCKYFHTTVTIVNKNTP